MTAYVVKGWCRICQARTLLSRVAQEDPVSRQPVAFTVCTECGEQVGPTGASGPRTRAAGEAEDRHAENLRPDERAGGSHAVSKGSG